MMIIDPPSVFDPLSEWTAFRERMEALLVEHPDDPTVRECLDEARRMEAELSQN